jgi:hypothetical protein
MDKKFVGLVSILFLAIFLLLLSLVTRGSTFNVQNPFAQEQRVASPTRSLMFAWPLTTAADGGQNAKIDVFVRNDEGDPLPGKTVVPNSTLGTLATVENPTNSAGKATFTLTSTLAGVAEITAVVDGIRLSQKLEITFE